MPHFLRLLPEKPVNRGVHMGQTASSEAAGATTSKDSSGAASPATGRDADDFVRIEREVY